MGTVMSHNVLRNVGDFLPFGSRLVTDANLLFAARVASLPMTIISGLIASYFPSGYLLIVAFDVVLATILVPLFGCFYTKRPSPLAALCAIIPGLVTRLTLEFALPKDGLLILPFPGDEFLNYGPVHLLPSQRTSINPKMKFGIPTRSSANNLATMIGPELTL